MRSKTLLAGLAAALLLSGCAGSGFDGMGPKQTGGVVLGGVGGAVAGGLLGSQMGRRGSSTQTIATGAGAVLGLLLGGTIGSSVGQSLDNADRAALQQNTMMILQPNAPIGRPIQWQNPNNGNQFRVTPTRELQGPSGEYCREYTQTVILSGRVEEAQGRACYQPDGTWRIAN